MFPLHVEALCVRSKGTVFKLRGEEATYWNCNHSRCLSIDETREGQKTMQYPKDTKSHLLIRFRGFTSVISVS